MSCGFAEDATRARERAWREYLALDRCGRPVPAVDREAALSAYDRAKAAESEAWERVAQRGGA